MKKHHSGFEWYLSRLKKMPPISEAGLAAFVSKLSNNPAPLAADRTQSIIAAAKSQSAILFDKQTQLWSGNPNWKSDFQVENL
jgi:hypothetical protein